MSTLLLVNCEAYCVKITDDTNRIWIARNRREWFNIRDILPKVPMTCSSSLNWPTDVTHDLNVIDVCNIIKGNSVLVDEIIEMHKENGT